MASGRSIEVKVGILILIAAGVLGTFILIMGGINFQPTYTLYADFDNPGGLQPGAPVKIAGVKVGSIEEVQFRGGRKNDATGVRDPLVRLQLSIEKRYKDSIFENSLFYVTTQGVLGEQFLAIEPGSSDRPVLPEGSTIRALDPPRLDMLLAESYELLHSTVAAVRDNKKEIAEVFEGLRLTLQGTGQFFGKNQDRLDRVLENVEDVSEEGKQLLEAANQKFTHNAQVDRILLNLDSVTARVAKDTPELLDDAKVTLKNARRVSDTLGGEAEQAKIRRALDDASALLSKANSTTSDAQAVVAHMRKGRGTVGALLMDEQLFDDLQEMVRDLKHNPWKFFWRE